ncbi:MFS general substrate transporter [Fomitiporia mediterranea MF3/22]|uniref:MFS general substrate transporter n=1 Tax=Fomitiporia mediterranea (strain MF3/22) TaxID=694068 RepID=UPI0004407DD3|nr:MFS general substrate transporter [Fomitiporia mediterranea MF3/22]EJC98676.1 MFS general substrate transporter [Fomitiporia mediterranea MF3/22]
MSWDSLLDRLSGVITLLSEVQMVAECDLGPLSEMYGRRLPYIISWPLLIVTCAPSAYIDNLATIIIFRFLSGCCAGCALNNGGGLLTDMYMADKRAQGIAIALYAASVFAGPCVALPVGFFITVNYGPEPWVLRVYLFFVASMLPVTFLLPETHGPTILADRSERMRSNGFIYARAAHELEQQSTKEFLRLHIGRPFSMFMREPIIQAAAVWTSLAYGITYLFFELYPVVFIKHYNFPLKLAGLPFLAMVVGFMAAIVLNPPLVRLFIHLPLPSVLQPEFVRPDSPEAKLKLSLLACVLMPGSLFWFAWTSGGGVHWIVPTLAGIPFGFAAMTIFFVFLTYTAETYTIYTNSANVCNTICRSTLASIFPLVASSLLKSLGTKWGVSLFGFLSLGLIPIPLILLRYGASIRTQSYYAQEAATVIARMREESGFGGTATVQLTSLPYRREERARREIHASPSMASMRTTVTNMSDTGTLVGERLKAVSAAHFGLARGAMDSTDTFDLKWMPAKK